MSIFIDEDKMAASSSAVEEVTATDTSAASIAPKGSDVVVIHPGSCFMR